MRKSSYWRAVEPAQGTAQPEQGSESNAGDNVDAEMAQILDDVEQLFGEPVFLTHWNWTMPFRRPRFIFLNVYFRQS